MEGLEILSYDGTGYDPTMKFGHWIVAIANYEERFDREKYTKIERHMKTDEVFVLLDGSASLAIGMNREVVELEPCKIYNVKAGVWHNILIDKGSKVLIVENSDTSRDNSEYHTF